jgi:ribosomal protein S18 acetylase RimI-like enzyme
MTTDDLPEVLAFWTTIDGIGLNESDTLECLEAYLSRNVRLSCVARDSDCLIGAVLCGHDGRRGYLHHLAVAPSHRRQHIGTDLVERCLRSLAAIGIQKCNIFVCADNDEGANFWLKTGWHRRNDLKLMQRPLSTA